MTIKQLIDRRVLSVMVLGLLFAHLDRTNLGFAAVQMSKDLGFSATVYGLGASAFNGRSTEQTRSAQFADPVDARSSFTGSDETLVRRGRTAWLLNLDRSNVTALSAALRTAQSFFEIRERRVPSTEVRQQIWIRTPFVSASGALDHQKALSELIGKTLNLEISRHERYCIYLQSRAATVFTAETTFEHDEWIRKGLSVLQQSRLPVVCARWRSWRHGHWQLGAVAGWPNRGSQPLQRGVPMRSLRAPVAPGASS